MARDNDTIRATPRYRSCKKDTLLGSTGRTRTSAWWDKLFALKSGGETLE